MGVRRGIDRKKVGCRSLIDANLEGQVGVNKFKLHVYSGTKTVHTELKQCIKFTHTGYLATRSKVESSIPIIEKNFSVEARTRDFSNTGIAR